MVTEDANTLLFLQRGRNAVVEQDLDNQEERRPGERREDSPGLTDSHLLQIP
jgi:hypothetical protein